MGCFVQICHCSLNIKQHSAKSAVAKAISGHSVSKSGMAVAIAAIPVAPPMIVGVMVDDEFVTDEMERHEWAPSSMTYVMTSRQRRV